MDSNERPGPAFGKENNQAGIFEAQARGRGKQESYPRKISSLTTVSPLEKRETKALRCKAAFAILHCVEAAVPESIVRSYAAVTVIDLVIRPRGR